MWHIVRGGALCMMTQITNNLLESASSWKRGVEPKEDYAWRMFHFGVG
jgi:hypothetical protein